eukprot:10427961-Prorocentrum_lima.AAC.1
MALAPFPAPLEQAEAVLPGFLVLVGVLRQEKQLLPSPVVVACNHSGVLLEERADVLASTTSRNS